MPKSSSGLLPWLAANRLRGKPVGPFDFWPKRPSNASWCREWDEKRSGLCCKATTRSRGGKKMWCVAELDEEYIARMEEVLSVYEKPLSARESVVCGRETSRPAPGSSVSRINEAWTNRPPG